jgi:uncharacterized membrane protein (DUF441 family)
MTTILLVLIGVIIFFIGIISPHTAGKIQRKTDEKASWLKRLSNWFWDPITWWTKKSIEFTRKAVVKIAQWGKRTRRKISSDNNKK